MAELMRPQSINRFGLAYAGWLVTWVLDVVLRWRIMVDYVLRQSPQAADQAEVFMAGGSAIVVLIAALVGALAWYRPNMIARWVSIVLLGIVAVLRVIGLTSVHPNLIGAIWVIGLAFVIAALWFAFRPGAVEWYRAPEPVVEPETETAI